MLTEERSGYNIEIMRVNNYSSTRDKAGHPECAFTPDPAPSRCPGTTCFASALHRRKTLQSSSTAAAFSLLLPRSGQPRGLGLAEVAGRVSRLCQRGCGAAVAAGVQRYPPPLATAPLCRTAQPLQPGPLVCSPAVRTVPEAPVKRHRALHCRGYRERTPVNAAGGTVSERLLTRPLRCVTCGGGRLPERPPQG